MSTLFKMKGFSGFGNSPAKKITHGSGQDWEHEHLEKVVHPNTPEAHNVSPAKQKYKSDNPAQTGVGWLAKKTGLDLKGYLKGKQGWIPDYKGQSTKETVHKIAKKVAKSTAPNVTEKVKKVKDSMRRQKASLIGMKRGVTIGAIEGVKGKQMKDSMRRQKTRKKVLADPKIKSRMMRSDIKMKPPYKKPVGPRAE